MYFMNGFVDNEIPQMRRFLDEISVSTSIYTQLLLCTDSIQLSSQSPPKNTVVVRTASWEPYQIDLGREISIMHTILTDQMKKLGEVATDTTQPSSVVAESASDKRVSEGTSASLPHHSSSPTISGGFASQDSCTSEACTARNETRSSNGSQHPPRIKIISNRNTKRGEERRRNNSEETTSPPAPSPSQLDEGLFPVINNEPILAVHDPTWPGVSECLVFERELVSWKKTTSTMIDPGKREVK